MNQTEYAAHRGVSRPYICRLIKLGKIPRAADGSIDADEADAALAAIADPGKAGVIAHHAAKRDATAPDAPASGPGDTETFSDSKRRDAKAAADMREMERDRIKGELIDRRAYAKGCEDAAIALGKELDNMIHRLAPQVFGAASITACRDLITTEVFRARDALADTLEALAADPRNGTRQ